MSSHLPLHIYTVSMHGNLPSCFVTQACLTLYFDDSFFVYVWSKTFFKLTFHHKPVPHHLPLKSAERIILQKRCHHVHEWRLFNFFSWWFVPCSKVTSYIIHRQFTTCQILPREILQKITLIFFNKSRLFSLFLMIC